MPSGAWSKPAPMTCPVATKTRVPAAAPSARAPRRPGLPCRQPGGKLHDRLRVRLQRGREEIAVAPALNDDDRTTAGRQGGPHVSDDQRVAVAVLGACRIDLRDAGVLLTIQVVRTDEIRAARDDATREPVLVGLLAGVGAVANRAAPNQHDWRVAVFPGYCG